MRGHPKTSEVHERRTCGPHRSHRSCAGWTRWRDCGRRRKDPVDRMWTQEGEQGLQVHSGDAESPRRVPFRAADRVVDSRLRDLRAAPQPGRSSMAEQAPPTHPRILYIEDNPESRALVRNVLEARGFDVIEASDGIAGIDL